MMRFRGCGGKVDNKRAEVKVKESTDDDDRGRGDGREMVAGIFSHTTSVELQSKLSCGRVVLPTFVLSQTGFSYLPHISQRGRTFFLSTFTTRRVSHPISHSMTCTYFPSKQS